jgi:hypothetical protein
MAHTGDQLTSYLTKQYINENVTACKQMGTSSVTSLMSRIFTDSLIHRSLYALLVVSESNINSKEIYSDAFH